MRIKLKFPKLTGPLRSYYNYFFGEKEIAYIYRHLKKYKKNLIFIDIGANYGIFTFLFSKIVNQTYVVEPIKECLEYIRNGIMKENVKFINKVASNSNKDITLKIPIIRGTKVYGKSSISNEFENYLEINVQSFRIDELQEKVSKQEYKVIFLKIDVEGHELEVLQGAKNLILNNKSILLIEIEKRHNKDYLKVFELLENLGFSLVFII
tara:strand:- start:160 stop:786 length:627 start_codon:yes stop_codon:yes gene_type:complete